MPWRIEAGEREYIINTGESVIVPAPEIIGNEAIKCHASTYLGASYLGFAEVNEGQAEIRSERYIYPAANNYEEDLKRRGVVVTFIK